MKCLLVSIFQTLRYLTTLPLYFFLVNRGFLLTVVAVILIACIFHMGTAMMLKVSTNLSYFFFFFKTVAEEKSLHTKRTVAYRTGTKRCMSVYVTKDFLCKPAASSNSI